MNTSIEPGNDVTLLLVGKTGSGISSTCKSIDATSEAKQLGGFVSISQGIETGEADYEGVTKVKVIATPGLRNDNLGDDREKTREAFFQNVICEAFQHAPGGFNAVILVLSYSERIDHEFTRIMENLKSVLGEDTVEQHMILVVTSADTLFHDDGAETAVEDWGKRQTSFFKELYDRCQSRCVLFNNVTDDEEKKKSQLKNLMSNVLGIQGPMYTYDKFAAVNFKYIREGRVNLASLKEILMKEYKRIFNFNSFHSYKGIYKMESDKRHKIIAVQKRVMEDALNEIKACQRVAHIHSLTSVVESVSILIDLAQDPTKDSKEFYKKLQEYKDGVETAFEGLNVFTTEPEDVFSFRYVRYLMKSL